MSCDPQRPIHRWFVGPILRPWVNFTGLVIIGFVPSWSVGLVHGHGQSLTPQAAAGDDTQLAPEERARRALDAANALDEQAQRATSTDESRACWLRATRLLDESLARDPQVASAASLRFQAAVYRWAWSRLTLDQVDLLPASNPAVIQDANALDDAIARFRAIPDQSTDRADPFAQNVRYRLAQALADRARLRPESDPGRGLELKEAQTLLDRAITTPRLRAFARLLHAELANRLGQYGPAQIEVEEAEKLTPPPPTIPTIEVKLTALAGRGQFAEAKQLVDRSSAGPEQKALWKLRIILARRQALTVGSDRAAIEAEAFALAASFRESNQTQARRGLMELARAIDEPGTSAPPLAWETLADGRLLLADPAGAARLAARGADAVPASDPTPAASLRLKSGACWFQAEKFAEADVVLSRLIDDLRSPASIRARAGMLRGLARGRALAARQPGASAATYTAALEAQVRDFPADPATNEARWLLGKLRATASRRDEAITLWREIPHGQPRWLEAESAAADRAIDAVEEQWINRDLGAVRPRLELARKLIRSGLDQATEGDEFVALGMKLARLESIPGIGQPVQAIDILDRILQGPGSPDQHQQARLARMAALAAQNRFADAETIARGAAKADQLGPLLPAIRRLDRLAGDTENDLTRRRTGSLLRTLLDRWVDPVDRTPPELRDEVQLRYARALFFAGDAVAARRFIAKWGGPSGEGDITTILRDLGDTYFRLEAYELAVETERVRGNKLAAGSPAWFDARYCLALALYRSDRIKEARKIIDATSILHPDLGGGETRARFERLGQKVAAAAD